MSKQENIKVTGVIKESHRDSRYTVILDNSGIEIKAIMSGKMRQNSIRIIPGDKVELEMSPYDLTHGRIVYRKR